MPEMPQRSQVRRCVRAVPPSRCLNWQCPGSPAPAHQVKECAWVHPPCRRACRFSRKSARLHTNNKKVAKVWSSVVSPAQGKGQWNRRAAPPACVRPPSQMRTAPRRSSAATPRRCVRASSPRAKTVWSAAAKARVRKCSLRRPSRRLN
jgi:hypothetical protein